MASVGIEANKGKAGKYKSDPAKGNDLVEIFPRIQSLNPKRVEGLLLVHGVLLRRDYRVMVILPFLLTDQDVTQPQQEQEDAACTDCV